MNEKLVFSSTDLLHTDHICSALKENNIAFYKKVQGTGEYFAITTGNTFNNEIRVFVNEDDYEKALELINEISPKDEATFETDIPDELKDISTEEEEEIENISKKSKGRSRKLILLLMLYPAIICILIVIIFNVLQNIKG